MGAVRQLAAQAAGYAQLPAEASAALAGHVERAAEAAVEASGTKQAPIELRFTGDGTAVNVHIACEAAQAPAPPPATHDNGVTVDWTSHGSRHLCHIRHRSPA